MKTEWNMKKILVLFCAFVALCACEKAYSVAEDGLSAPVSFNLTVSYPDSGVDATKAALKEGWEDGDVVYVFFKDIMTKYLKLSFNNGTWTTEAPGGRFDDADFTGQNVRRMTAVYIPHYEVDVTYDQQYDRIALTNAADGTTIYTWYMSANADYTFSNGEVSGGLTMTKPRNVVQFYVPNVPEADAPLYRLREANLKPTHCSTIYSSGLSTGTRAAGISLKGFAYKGGVLFGAYLDAAGKETAYSFQLVKYLSADNPCAVGTHVISGTRTIKAGYVVRFPELSHDAWTYGQWVDMGTAGKWATGNLTDDGQGSGSIVAPNATGKYYAWGETVGHERNSSGEFTSHSFNWDTYQHGNASSYALTKYCTDDVYGNKDDLTELTRGDVDCDDAATKNLGSGWRMPAEAEYEELSNTSKFNWVWQDSAYTINGMLVTCKATGLSMFLPAAWCGGDSSFAGFGVYGFCWASTLNTDTSGGACVLQFSNAFHGLGSRSRFIGCPVRAVKVPE